LLIISTSDVEIEVVLTSENTISKGRTTDGSPSDDLIFSPIPGTRKSLFLHRYLIILVNSPIHRQFINPSLLRQDMDLGNFSVLDAVKHRGLRTNHDALEAIVPEFVRGVGSVYRPAAAAAPSAAGDTTAGEAAAMYS
jgi:hypothetical protein